MTTFNDYEQSLESGVPVRCYLFQRGGLSYAYTSADRTITIASIDFVSGMAASDGGLEQAGSAEAVSMEITLSAFSDLANLYKEYIPTQPMEVTVWDIHYDADVANPDYVVAFIGRVADVTWSGDATMKLACQTIAAGVDSPGLRKSWQRGCSNSLYDGDCTISQEAYRVDDVAVSFDGLTVTVGLLNTSVYPDNWFAGGIVAWASLDGGLEMRGIRTQVGRVLTLYGGTDGMPPSAPLRLYPGCDRTIETCASKFNNSDNFGGCPQLPGRSPFTGNPFL